MATYTPPRREFLMQPSIYDAGRDSLGGYFVSELLSGVRVFWDGGLSRGKRTTNIPYANAFRPDSCEVRSGLLPVATGLWSEDGSPVAAPDWFLNMLPCMPLDGILCAGPDQGIFCRKLVSDKGTDDRWQSISFAVFGSPPINQVFRDGRLTTSSTKFEINYSDTTRWMHSLDESIIADYYFFDTSRDGLTFEKELALLRGLVPPDGPIHLANHKKLPPRVSEATKVATGLFDTVVKNGGKGLIYRQPEGEWAPLRTRSYLKEAA